MKRIALEFTIQYSIHQLVVQFNTIDQYPAQFAIHFQKIYKKLSYNPLGSSILLLLVITNLQSLLELNSCQGGQYSTVSASTTDIYLLGTCTSIETQLFRTGLNTSHIE